MCGNHGERQAEGTGSGHFAGDLCLLRNRLDPCYADMNNMGKMVSNSLNGAQTEPRQD
jgi:hypothetical protein